MESLLSTVMFEIVSETLLMTATAVTAAANDAFWIPILKHKFLLSSTF